MDIDTIQVFETFAKTLLQTSTWTLICAAGMAFISWLNARMPMKIAKFNAKKERKEHLTSLLYERKIDCYIDLLTFISSHKTIENAEQRTEFSRMIVAATLYSSKKTEEKLSVVANDLLSNTINTEHINAVVKAMKEEIQFLLD